MTEADPTDWFDPLYQNADTDGRGVPWANMETHPSFGVWLTRHDLQGDGSTALVVGCGMGDDAIELATRGFRVTAFDVSAAAIAHCRRRFGAGPGEHAVEWVVADLFDPPARWKRHFDFVLEIYTIQSLPPRYEEVTIDRITDFVAPDGRLLTIAMISDEPRSDAAGPPWILTPAHVDAIGARELDLIDQFVHEKGSRRGDVSVATFQRPA